MKYESFTLLIDLNQSPELAPALDRIMKQVRSQPSLLAEEAKAYQWPDTLEIHFPEVETEIGCPLIVEDDLKRPITSYPLPDEYIDRSIITDLKQRSLLIPTLIFLYEGVALVMIAGEAYVAEFDSSIKEEDKQRINARNIVAGFQTPVVESTKITNRRNQHRRFKALEEAERTLRAKEQEDAQKAREKAKLKNLLKLPDRDDFRPRFLHARLEEAGITVSLKTVENRVSAATRPPKLEGEKQKSGDPLFADHSLAIEILTEFFNKQKK